MSYKRTAFDKFRLHVGGVILTGMVLNSIEGKEWIIAAFLCALLMLFMRMEAELLPKRQK